MKVTIAVRAKWHSFQLAQQLDRRGALQRIITGYPRFKLRDTTVPAGRTVSLPSLVLQEAIHRVPVIGSRLNPRLDYWNRWLFDRLATRYLTNSDIVVSWAGSARRTIRKAKEYGARTVLECGAVHAGHLNDIFRGEYERLGIRFTDDGSPVSYPGSLECELAEYDTADYLAVPSEFVRQSFLQKGVAEAKLLKAPYGTDSETFRPMPKQDGTFRALYVGAVSILKGIPVLLEAWRELAQTGAMELMLVGRVTPAMQKILARSGGQVRIAGRVEHRQLSRVYSSGSVFVFPSLVDGWPLVVGEAMACGLPVICTANSGACELVRDGVEGFVVPARDAEAIAEKVDYLRRNEDRRRLMAGAARARAVEYSWDRYGELVWKNYSAIVM